MIDRYLVFLCFSFIVTSCGAAIWSCQSPVYEETGIGGGGFLAVPESRKGNDISVNLSCDLTL